MQFGAQVTIDGFYRTVFDRAALPDDLRKLWQEGNLPRYKQIAETLRRSFKIGA
jgi:hypothetical protein